MSDILAFSDQNGERIIGDMSTTPQNGFKKDAIKPSKLEIPYSIGSIPIKAIGQYAFYQCFDIKECIIKAKIHTLHVAAFSGCKNLMNINIPSSVQLIENSALDGRIDSYYPPGPINIVFESHSRLKQIDNAGFSNHNIMNVFINDIISPICSTYIFGGVKSLQIFSTYSFKMCDYQTTLKSIMIQSCQSTKQRNGIINPFISFTQFLLTI